MNHRQRREADLQAKFRLFRRQREVLIRRSITMGVIILMLIITGAVNDYREQVYAARRGAIPPTQSADSSPAQP